MTGGYLQSMLFLMNRPEPIRQSSLLMILATGLDDPQSLTSGLQALSAESRPPWSNRVQHLRALLEQGQSLSDALRNAGSLLPEQSLVAISVAEDSGALRQVLADEAQRLMSDSGSNGPVGGSVSTGIATMLAIGIIVLSMLTFLMTFIIPKFKRIFQDFGVQLPEVTTSLIDWSDWFLSIGYLTILPAFTITLYGIWFAVSSSIKRLSEGHVRGAGWFPRYWSPLILRVLSIQVAAKKPLTGAFHSILTRLTPGRAQQRLSAVRAQTDSGIDCWEALSRQGFLRSREVAFLHSARRNNHLDWGLLHLSRMIERSHDAWTKRLQNAITPLAILLMGAAVGFVCVGMFSPLLELISELSPEASR